MVKFSFLALAGALATANAASHSRTIKLGNRQLRRGDASTEALLKKAQPYKKAGAARQLEENQFEIDGSYSIKFSQCVEVKTKDENLFDENMIAYAQAGQVVSTKSYVLFHVCQGDNCYYESEQDLYIVDLATYLTNVATFHAEKRMNYCNACEKAQDYCNPEEEEAVEEEAAEEDAAEEQGEEDNAEEGEEGEEDRNEEQGEEQGQEQGQEGQDRKLKKTSRRAKNYVNCNQCEAYGCFEEEAEAEEGEEENQNQQQNQQQLDESVSKWIENLAECQETGVVDSNGNELYVGAMCSPYGDGVELAVFLDDACTMYTTQKSFNSVYSDYSYQQADGGDENQNSVSYVTYAENYIKSAFSDTMSCLEEEFDEYNEDENEDENQQEEEEEYRVSGYCEGIFKDGAADFNNCGAEENEAEEEEANDDMYNWYTADMSADDAEDIATVCAVVNKMEGAYAHAYDEESSGTWYSRNKNGQIIVQGQEESSSLSGEESSSLSGGAIAAIVLLIGGVVGAAAFVMKKKSTTATASDYQGGQLS